MSFKKKTSPWPLVVLVLEEMNARRKIVQHHNTKQEVCKHWLRGLCKLGDTCPYLHVYNVEKMPKCDFYNSPTSCLNDEVFFFGLFFSCFLFFNVIFVVIWLVSFSSYQGKRKIENRMSLLQKRIL